MRCFLQAALFLSGLLVGSLAVAQTEFCDDLQTILATADDGFTAVRGELITQHLDVLSDQRVLWECTHTLSGVRTCEVEWFRQAFTYNTYWHRQGEEGNADVFEALTELITGCGLVRKASSRSGRSHWFVIEDHPGIDITVAYNSRRVRFSCAASGFPNP